jgi:sugar lactone lactonase YvrE
MTPSTESVPLIRLSLLTLIALTGCNTDLANPTEIATAQAPLPQVFTLSVDATQAGQPVTFQISGAPPNATVKIILANRGDVNVPGPCPPVLGGECLDIDGPLGLTVLSFVLTTSNAGNAQRQLIMPASVPDGTQLAFQAVIPSTATGSNPVLVVTGPPIVDNSTIYVLDSLNLNPGFLYQFDDMTGANPVVYGGELGTPFYTPNDVIKGADGKFYVTTYNGNLLYRFDDMTGNGHVEYDGGIFGAFSDPSGVAIDSQGRIYVSDYVGRIYRFDDMGGTNQVTYDGTAGTRFTSPSSIYIDANDKIYVTDFGTDLVYRFDDMNGANQVEYGGTNGTPFQNPREVVTDDVGNIYVVDLTNELAYRFSNMTGAGHVEYNGSAGTHFDRPESIDVDANGRIYVVDLGTDLMVAFDDMSGAGQVETTTVATPVSIYAEDN